MSLKTSTGIEVETNYDEERETEKECSGITWAKWISIRGWRNLKVKEQLYICSKENVIFIDYLAKEMCYLKAQILKDWFNNSTGSRILIFQKALANFNTLDVAKYLTIQSLIFKIITQKLIDLC